jgi:cation diffusion facilitator family transporter
MIGVIVSGSLAALKITIGWMAGSTSVMADGFESFSDIFASGFVWIGLWLAAKPPDENHPYGHGRVETLAGMMVGLGLVLAGVAICYHSLGAVGQRHAPPAAYAIWPLLVSLVAKAGLSWLKFSRGRQLGSAALVADAWNDSVDVLSAMTALVAVSLTLYDPSRFLAADHFGGVAVGAIVVFLGMHLAYNAAVQLIDTMPDEERMEEIRVTAAAVDGVRGVEKCFARKTGFQYHVDLHLEVDPNLTVRASHDIAARVRAQVRERLNWVADVLVHVEPSP